MTIYPLNREVCRPTWLFDANGQVTPSLFLAPPKPKRRACPWPAGSAQGPRWERERQPYWPFSDQLATASGRVDAVIARGIFEQTDGSLKAGLTQ